MFNLDQIIPCFGSVNRKHYLGELLWDASALELRQFRGKVKAHQKKSKFVKDIHNMSAHDTIIAAVNFELLKRSKWYPIYKSLLPIRIKLVSLFSGVDLQEHPYCGAIYAQRQNRKTIFHITMSELIFTFRNFWFLHWQWLIGAFIGFGVFIVALLGYIDKK